LHGISSRFDGGDNLAVELHLVEHLLKRDGIRFDTLNF
jgi:hypothetical protein